MVKRQTSAVDRYLDLPYHITLVQDGEENGGKWVAAAEELPDCTSRADTAEEAIAGLKGAMADWIAVALKEGRDIPEPRSEATPSGRLLLRMPRTLHAALTKAAERENVSLNQFITDSLASVVGWRRGATAARPGTHGADQPGARRGRLDRGTALERAATRAASPVMAGAAAASDRRADGELPARGDRRHDRDPRAHRRAAVAGRSGGFAARARPPQGACERASTSRSPRCGTSRVRHGERAYAAVCSKRGRAAGQERGAGRGYAAPVAP